MNMQEADVLRTLNKGTFINQRILAETSGHSLGVVNKSLKILINDGYLDNNIRLTPLAKQIFEDCKPRNAIILAAGFGMRMVPINMTTPKALLKVNGERLIERIILQLRAVGIKNITVVVGFMKESFEYLIDEYGVDLVVNSDYASHNNLHSLSLVANKLNNTYIVPSDLWCEKNPFQETELYSWYMVSDLIDEESSVRVNRKMELVRVSETNAGNSMVGIAYLLEPEAQLVREKLLAMDNEKHVDDFWEETLYSKDRMIVQARIFKSSDVVEINTYEQLRELDSDSSHLKSEAISTITQALQCNKNDVVDINVLKKGMTNRSFLFSVKGERYIMRIPGEGTAHLINRKKSRLAHST